jgi:hypothetical protein
MLAGLTVRDVLLVLAISAGVLVGLWFVLWLTGHLIHRFADRLAEKHRAHVAEVERWAQQFTQLVRRTIQAIAAVLALFFLLRRLGLRGQVDWADLSARIAGTSLRILLVIIGAYFLSRLLHLCLTRLPIRDARGHMAELLSARSVITVSRTLAG